MAKRQMDDVQGMLNWIKDSLSTEIPRNRWWEFNLMRVYLRVHKMRGIPTVEIGNIEVIDEDMRGKGLFTTFETTFEDLIKDSGVRLLRIMNILEPRLIGFCKRNGFLHMTELGDISPSYEKELS